MAFLFNTRKVNLSGLACQVVLAGKQLEKMGRQWDRTPYAVGFRTLGKSWTLVSAHVRWARRRNGCQNSLPLSPSDPDPFAVCR